MPTPDEKPGTDSTSRLDQLEAAVRSLRDRAERSEVENRILKWVGVAAILALAGFIGRPHAAKLLGFSDPATATWSTTEKGIAGEEFSLKNRKGVQVSVLESDKFGAPNLVMVDLERRYRIGLKVWDDHHADLSLFDASGRLRARLGVDKDGQAALVFATEEGRDRIRLGIGADGKPSLQMRDEDGKILFQAP
ncbi:MAG: hypothetical protein SFX72_18340 [Isosphaeraceae bacterium]|nr:hypothetical protein [Isosphaeraceae bacterium]